MEVHPKVIDTGHEKSESHGPHTTSLTALRNLAVAYWKQFRWTKTEIHQVSILALGNRVQGANILQLNSMLDLATTSRTGES